MTNQLRTIFLALLCFSLSAFAGSKVSSKKQSRPIQKQQKQSTLPSLVFADSYNVRIQELDSLEADCNEDIISQALNGDRRSFLRVLATMAIAPIFMRETTDTLGHISQLREKIASQGDIDYADWETIKEYFDTFQAEKYHVNVYRQLYQLRSSCRSLLEPHEELVRQLDISAQSIYHQMEQNIRPIPPNR